MAKAHCPPTWSKRQTYYVSQHAQERLRERVQVPAYLGNAALVRAADDAIRKAVEVGSFRTLPGGTKLVKISPEETDDLTIPSTFFAVLKPNDKEDGTYPEVVVTVLTPEMAARNYPSAADFTSGSTEGSGTLTSSPFSELSRFSPFSELSGIGEADRAVEDGGEEFEESEGEEEPEDCGEEQEDPFDGEEFYLILDGEEEVLRGTAEEVKEHLRSYTDRLPEVLRCRPVRVRVRVELE